MKERQDFSGSIIQEKAAAENSTVDCEFDAARRFPI